MYTHPPAPAPTAVVLGAGTLVRDFDPWQYPADADFAAAAREAMRDGRRIGLTAAEDAACRFDVIGEPLPVRVAGQTAPLREIEEAASVRAELTCALAFGSPPPQTVWNLCWLGERADGGVAAIHMPLAVMSCRRSLTAADRAEASLHVTYVGCRELGRPDRTDSTYGIRIAKGGAAQ